jgi:hypothetical protein
VSQCGPRHFLCHLSCWRVQITLPFHQLRCQHLVVPLSDGERLRLAQIEDPSDSDYSTISSSSLIQRHEQLKILRTERQCGGCQERIRNCKLTTMATDCLSFNLERKLMRLTLRIEGSCLLFPFIFRCDILDDHEAFSLPKKSRQKIGENGNGNLSCPMETLEIISIDSATMNFNLFSSLRLLLLTCEKDTKKTTRDLRSIEQCLGSARSICRARHANQNLRPFFDSACGLGDVWISNQNEAVVVSPSLSRPSLPAD